MRTAVSQDQVNRYQEDGFLIVRNFLSEDERAELINAITVCVKDYADTRIIGDDRIEGSKYNPNKDDFYSNVFLQKVNMWKVNKTVKQYMLSPKIGEMVCKLAGVEGMRVWHDQTLQKKPWANPTSFHLDNPYWSFTNRDAISIWIALDDATLQNGCLSFIPGSHKLTSTKNLGIGPNFGDLFEVYPEFKKSTPVYAEMKAGDASFHNGYSIHGAGANMTPGWRRAMTCGYMPEGSTFNGIRNILPKDYFDSLKIGDVLDSDELNPLIWSTKKPVLSECV
jgi:phytanoyl-CoA hydroxylase